MKLNTGKIVIVQDTAELNIEGIMLSDELFIAEKLSEDAIIGIATLNKRRPKLYLEQDRVLVNQMLTRFMLK